MKRLMTVLFASTMLLAACGNSDSTGSSSPTPTSNFNDADVTFAQGMIPHHQQAVEMADLALKNAKSAEVLGLAKQIKAAQDPEIETMTGWLKAWDAPLKTSSGSGMDHMDDGKDTGMMSASEMGKLEKATGAAFDKMFLTMMIQHHTGAIAQAKTEQAKGKNADAKALAAGIIKAQKAEISTMQGLLDAGN